MIWVCWNIRDSPGVSAGLACTRYRRPSRTVNSLYYLLHKERKRKQKTENFDVQLCHGFHSLDFIGLYYYYTLRVPSLRGAMGEIITSTIFHLDSSFLAHIHSSYTNYTRCKVSLISLTYFLSYDLLFLEIRTYVQNLSLHTNFKYII